MVTNLDMIIVCQEAYHLAYIKISSKFCPSNLSSLRNVCLHSRRLLVATEGGKSSFFLQTSRLVKPELVCKIKASLNQFKSLSGGWYKDRKLIYYNIICHWISTGVVPASLQYDWSRAGLRTFPYEDRLPKSYCFVGSNALKNTLSKAKIHKKRYFLKTCIKMFQKFSEMLGRIFGKVENCQKTVKKCF